MSFPRYPKYKESGVEWLGKVPAHWGVMPIRRAARLESGHTPSRSHPEYWEDCTVPWFTLADVWQIRESKADFIFETKEKVSKVGLANSSARLLPQGTVMLSRTASVGFSAIMGTPMATTQDFANWVCGDELVPEYLLYALRSMGGEFRRLMMGSTHNTIYMPDIQSLRFPLPPRDEQAAIVRLLRSETAKIDALVAEQQRLMELLKEKRQAVISHAVTKGLNPDAPMKASGVEWLGEVPAHWEVKRLKHLSPFICVGIVVDPTKYVSEDGLPFVYGGDIREGVVDWIGARRISPQMSELASKTRLQTGDLLTVRVGAPGVTAVVPSECEGGNCASVMLVRKGEFNSDWLCFLMNTRVVRFQVEVVQYGAAQEQFNISHAVNFWLPQPPRAEQDAITEFLHTTTGRLDSLIGESARAVDLLHERRSALITSAVTGQIDVSGNERAIVT